jgi:hypothetical protein
MSLFEAHPGFFGLLMKGKFDAYVCTVVTFWEKVDFLILNLRLYGIFLGQIFRFSIVDCKHELMWSKE